MIRIIALILVLIAVSGAIYFFFFNPKSPVEVPATNLLEEVPATLESTTSARVTPTPKASSKVVSSTTEIKALESRISVLEQAVNVLQKQPTSIQTQTTTQTTSKAPTYIFASGSNQSTAQNDWTTLSNLEFSIDPADYSGYSSMQLEVSLKVHQGNGKAYARLFNNTDGTAILSSEVSTSAENYTWVSSSTFSLPSGKKTYRLQLKTLTGYEASALDARIKVNF